MMMQSDFDRICVMGLGYIGLPTASLLATKGMMVHGCDINPRVVDTINSGNIHIVENDLDVLVRLAVNSQQLKASLEPDYADVFIITVPTPLGADRQPDISYIKASVEALNKYIKPGNLIILESTSPVGTTEKLVELIKEFRPDLVFSAKDGAQEQVYVAYCPERVLPGQILKELIENDRIIGGIDEPSAQKAEAFYETFVEGKVLLTNAKTAEMAKLTENAFRDVNIAFANEVSMICEDLGINAWNLINFANHHPRVNILNPGPGVGGHCIAVDPWFIVAKSPEQAQLISIARNVNDNKKLYVIDKIKKAAKSLHNPTIACLGLSFKSNIDDLRESPALDIVKTLAKGKIGNLLVVEPHITKLPKELSAYQTEINFCDINAAFNQADIIVLLVKHNDFCAIDKNLLQNKIIIDTQGIWQ
jgi:UDP-N-acetyl-D-mannosaminuronic acid dehydrogenase